MYPRIVVNTRITNHLKRELVTQDKVLARAGAFYPVHPSKLPEEWMAAKDVMVLALRRKNQVVWMGVVFGVAMGTLGAGFLYWETQSMIASGIMSLVVGLFGGGLFGIAMRPFVRDVVLPLKHSQADEWRAAIEAVGYRCIDSCAEQVVFAPNWELGSMAGQLFVCIPSTDMAFMVGPAQNVSKVVVEFTQRLKKHSKETG